MPTFRKRNGGVIFYFFSSNIDDSLVPKKIKEIVKRGRNELTINKKETHYKKSKQLLFGR